ncbi:Zinc finger CCCH domain-containing protein 12 [Hordeum vulgare]|nr:Zinc finger CCCH domain-containing protein 12 [Hordeum vulgare]
MAFIERLSYMEVLDCLRLKVIENKASNISSFQFAGNEVQLSLGKSLQVKSLKLHHSCVISHAIDKLPSIVPNLERLNIISPHEGAVRWARDKAKGARKLRAADVALNHRLVSWRVGGGAGDGPAATGGYNYRGASASAVLAHPADGNSWHAEDEEEDDADLEAAAPRGISDMYDLIIGLQAALSRYSAMDQGVNVDTLFALKNQSANSLISILISFVCARNAEGMWQQMTMNSGVTMQSGPYHVRPGEPDCTYYLRTGLCSFGMSCTFNHPQDRNTSYVEDKHKVVGFNFQYTGGHAKYDQKGVIAQLCVCHNILVYHYCLATRACGFVRFLNSTDYRFVVMDTTNDVKMLKTLSMAC